MGVTESKKNEQKNRDNTQQRRDSGSTNGNIQNDIRDVLLLYRASDKKQRKVIRAFEDALVRTAKGQVNIFDKIDVSKDVETVKGLEWLNEMDNVILVQLSNDAVECAYITNLVREKRFVDGNGVLNNKIIAVSFGKSLPDEWLKLRRTASDKKDFCFEFKDEDEITDDDFESSCAVGKINALVRALAAAN